MPRHSMSCGGPPDFAAPRSASSPGAVAPPAASPDAGRPPPGRPLQRVLGCRREPLPVMLREAVFRHIRRIDLSPTAPSPPPVAVAKALHTDAALLSGDPTSRRRPDAPAPAFTAINIRRTVGRRARETPCHAPQQAPGQRGGHPVGVLPQTAVRALGLEAGTWVPSGEKGAWAGYRGVL